MRTKFIINVKLPNGMLKSEMRSYIRVAIQAWCKSYHPDDPVFDLNPNTVGVTPIVKKNISRHEIIEIEMQLRLAIDREKDLIKSLQDIRDSNIVASEFNSHASYIIAANALAINSERNRG